MTAPTGDDEVEPPGSAPPGSPAPPRVRVTAPRIPVRGAQRAGEASGSSTTDATGATGGTGAFRRPGATGAFSTPGAQRGADATDEPDASDVRGVYVRSLIRSQLQLGLVCAAAFVLATTLFVLAIVWTPALDESFIAGVPVSWLLLAFGVYPLALTIAALYVWAAARNESRYRSLAEEP